MPKTILINSSNIVANTYNSTFEYNFPQGGVNFRDDLIAVQQVSIYNSVFNITSANNNNSFSYTWVDGTTIPVPIPDSYLDCAGINAYLQSIMYSETHYLTDADGNIVYLLEIVVNQARYAFQINSYLIDTTIATANSWTLPAGATWVLPTTNSIMPMFVVPSTNIQTLIGFTAGSYPNTTITGSPPTQSQTPPQSASYSALSSIAPQIIPIPTYLGVCNLVQNKLAIPSQLIYSLTIEGVSFGSLYVNQISTPVFNDIADGQYTTLRFSFVDSTGNYIRFNDPNTMIILIIKNRFEGR
jgi:hypothetical protein